MLVNRERKDEGIDEIIEHIGWRTPECLDEIISFIEEKNKMERQG